MTAFALGGRPTTGQDDLAHVVTETDMINRRTPAQQAQVAPPPVAPPPSEIINAEGELAIRERAVQYTV